MRTNLPVPSCPSAKCILQSAFLFVLFALSIQSPRSDSLDETYREGQVLVGDSVIIKGSTISGSDLERSKTRIREIQEMLTELGFGPVNADGVLGVRTRAAIVAFQHFIGVPPDSNVTEALEHSLARFYFQHHRTVTGRYAKEQGMIFRDCSVCPEMVIIPSGSFAMGSPLDEDGREDDEGPQHDAAISRFALGRFEVTRGQFARFVVATNHKTGRCVYWDVETHESKWGDNLTWRDPGFEQADDHPVTCVSWEDAEAYVDWLGKITGEFYRLPTEKEWEYAARAGTTTRFFWGDDAKSGCTFANGNDVASERANKLTGVSSRCDDGYVETSPIGIFEGNNFDLHDMTGNVWEWISDKYHEQYIPYKTPPEIWNPLPNYENSARVLRGGSWSDNPEGLRVANRAFFGSSGMRAGNIGFRVARRLGQTPPDKNP